MPRKEALSFAGYIKRLPNGRKRLIVKSLPFFNTHIQKLDGEVRITIEEKKKVRSYKQNARYWGAMIERGVKDASEHTGYTKDELHHIFKTRHLQPKILKDPIDGQYRPFYTTKFLTPGEFAEYGHLVEQDLAELGIKVLTPKQFYEGI